MLAFNQLVMAIAASGVAGPLYGSSISMDFANGNYSGGTLANLLSVSRASPAATLGENADGSLSSFAANVARVTTKGIWVEAAATNLILQSQTLDNAYWTTSGSSVVPNGGTAPDGTATADYVLPSAATIPHLISTGNVTVATSSYAVTVYVKPNGYYKFGIREGAVTGAYATWDLRGAGAVIAVSGATGYVQALTGAYAGWYRVTMVYAASAGVHLYQNFVMDGGYLSGSPLAYSYLGDAVSGAYVWGAQAETGARPTTYVPTVAATVTRNVEVISLAGAADTLIKTANVSVLAVTPPRKWPTNAGDRLIGSPTFAPLCAGSDSAVQSGNGTGFPNVAINHSATYSANEVWSMVSWQPSLTTVVANGGTPGPDASSMSTITTAYLGSSNGSNVWNGCIKGLYLYNTTKTGAQMQAITAAGDTFSPAIVSGWGDSLTSGNQDGSGVSWPTALAPLLGAQTVYNNGVGGETSTQIETRFIAFTAGYGNPNVFEMGRNNFSAPTTVKADIATAVAACTTSHYLVCGVLPFPTDTGPNLAAIATLNGDLATLYTTHFVDLLTPLQAGGNGGTNDNADIAAGLVPRSLRVSSGDGHLNAAGYTIMAQAIYAKRAILGF